LGVFTENPYTLDFKRCNVYYLDSVKVKSLTTPEDRLPGKKEVPVLWNRGSAVSDGLKSLQWQEKNIQKRQCLLSNAYYRYYNFIQMLIAFGIPPHMPKGLGGWGLDHYKGKNLRRTTGKYRAALKVIFRDDQSVNNLLDTESMGSIWSPLSFSPHGEEAERRVRAIFENGTREEVTSISSLVQRGLLELDPPLEDFKVKTLAKNLSRILKVVGGEWYTFKEAYSVGTSRIRSRLGWLKGDLRKRFKPPPLKVLGKKLEKICDSIISRDPSSARRSAPIKSEDLSDRLFWRSSCVLVNRFWFDLQLRMMLKDLETEEISKVLIDPVLNPPLPNPRITSIH
jgi:hypothetical protein